MVELNCEKMELVSGGINLNGSILNYGVKAFRLVFDLGRALGSSIRRVWGNNLCSLK